MNARWKIGIHIAATLIIGIVIGALLNRALVRHWMREQLTMREAGLRVPGGGRPFKATDAAQDAKIQAVLDRHAQKMAAMRARHIKEIETAFASLKSEFDPILTPEQKVEFDKLIPGPPPGMGGWPGGFRGVGGPGGLGPGRFPGVPPGPGGPGPGMPWPVERGLGPGGPGRPRGFAPGGLNPGELPFSHGPFSGPFGLAVMKAELKLSDDQAAKIKAIQNDYNKKFPWTPESGPKATPEELRKAEQDMQTAFFKILTDEQKTTLAKLPAGPRSRPPHP